MGSNGLLGIILSVLYVQVSHAYDISNKVGQSHGYWSSWNYWTACSRTCGGGVTFRSRYCLYRNSLTDLRDCEGPSREYALCNNQPCPGGVDDFRRIQCSVYDELDQYGVVRQWFPIKETMGDCLLQCEKKHNSLLTVAKNFGRVVDGTSCLNDEQRGVCIQGICRSVGCNGLLDSTLHVDSCGVCGGMDNSCGSFSGTFTTELAAEELFRYYDVITLQAGSRNITVEERSEVNQLALSVGNVYYLNGNWAIQNPGTFLAAGAIFRYDRKRDGYETIISDGPINRNVKISLIVRAEDPVVTYRFYLPAIPLYIPTVTSLPALEPHRENSFQLTNSVNNRNETTDQTMYLTTPDNKAFTIAVQSEPEETTLPKILTPQTPGNKKEKRKKTKKKIKEHLSKKEVRAMCGKCHKVRGKLEHFCHSDFVVQAVILDRAIVDDKTRYDVHISRTFSNKMTLFSREYFWVPNICNCPRLKVDMEYLIMGNRVQDSGNHENLLMVDRDSMVLKWKPERFDVWNFIQSHSKNKCYKLMRSK